MKEIRWDLEKSRQLKEKRGVSFEEIIQSKMVGIMTHPMRKNQKVLLFEHKNYIWVVPCVMQREEIFLKTLFPSRKYTKMWKEGKLNG
ncbi:MAG TPA: toxin [Deltaproteobacteria bacterium]|nr:MAG: hypothetical protein A2048_07070 [Deltaproteobacteria bacterium GWA2_45_12]HBF13842.1 toxin [Deltaproteobacteria bacterium]